MDFCESLEFYKCLSKHTILHNCAYNGATTHNSCKIKKAFNQPNTNESVL